jgi:hypothetical protein
MSKSDGGKGSSPRPFSVAQAEYEARWDAIFGRDRVQEALDKKADNARELDLDYEPSKEQK